MSLIKGDVLIGRGAVRLDGVKLDGVKRSGMARITLNDSVAP